MSTTTRSRSLAIEEGTKERRVEGDTGLVDECMGAIGEDGGRAGATAILPRHVPLILRVVHAVNPLQTYMSPCVALLTGYVRRQAGTRPRPTSCDTVDWLSHIMSKSGVALCRGQSSMIERLLGSIHNMYEDVKHTLGPISYSRASDVFYPGSDEPLYCPLVASSTCPNSSAHPLASVAPSLRSTLVRTLTLTL